MQGEVPADQMVLTYWRGKTNYPWPQQALRGSVTFTDGKMCVKLELPYYNEKGDAIDHYTRYKLNGVYSLKYE